MNTSREYLHQLIEQITDKEIPEAIDFLEYLKLKKAKEEFKDLEDVSLSSTEFWNNDIDDEVWNDV
jgi:hypothetical protein